MASSFRTVGRASAPFPELALPFPARASWVSRGATAAVTGPGRGRLDTGGSQPGDHFHSGSLRVSFPESQAYSTGPFRRRAESGLLRPLLPRQDFGVLRTE